MKERFEDCEVEVVRFDAEDVITTSPTYENCDNKTEEF